jgi:hypothetical protein
MLHQIAERRSGRQKLRRQFKKFLLPTIEKPDPHLVIEHKDANVHLIKRLSQEFQNSLGGFRDQELRHFHVCRFRIPPSG